MLKRKYTICTVSLCRHIMRILAKNPHSSLSDIKSYCKSKSDFNQLIYKIRKIKVNSIPL